MSNHDQDESWLSFQQDQQKGNKYPQQSNQVVHFGQQGNHERKTPADSHDLSFTSQISQNQIPSSDLSFAQYSSSQVNDSQSSTARSFDALNMSFAEMPQKVDPPQAKQNRKSVLQTQYKQEEKKEGPALRQETGGFKKKGRVHEQNSNNQIKQENSRIIVEDSTQRVDPTLNTSSLTSASSTSTNKQEKQKKAGLRPRGLKSWPELSMYIKQRKLSLCYRQVLEFACDIIIIPYKDLKFEVYPGNLVNSFKVDYRKKIESKGSRIQKMGCVYIQKCLGLDNFVAIGFLCIGGEEPVDLKVCIPQIFGAILNCPQKLRSILIPYSEALGSFDELLALVMREMEQNSGFEVTISTNKGSEYRKGSVAFNKIMHELIDKNMFSIDF